jgi:hypothetical protein
LHIFGALKLVRRGHAGLRRAFDMLSLVAMGFNPDLNAKYQQLAGLFISRYFE